MEKTERGTKTARALIGWIEQRFSHGGDATWNTYAKKNGIEATHGYRLMTRLGLDPRTIAEVPAQLRAIISGHQKAPAFQKFIPAGTTDGNSPRGYIVVVDGIEVRAESVEAVRNLVTALRGERNV